MTAMISIVVPFFNVQDYAETCIQSIIEQTYENLQIILVNDGSTDASGEICEKYARLDKRIIYKVKKNGGLSDARNHGLQYATGDYVTFIDSDDFINKRYIEALYVVANKENADITSCSYVRVDTSNRPLNEEVSEDIYDVESSNCMSFYFQNKCFGVMAWGKLYKMELFKKYNILYPKGKYHEDTYTTYKLVAKSKKVIALHATLYYYRWTPESIVNQSFNIKHLDAIYAALEQSEYINVNYPESRHYANGQIIYSCNQVLMKMFDVGYDYSNIKFLIKKQYRLHLIDYINSSKSLKGKLFAVLCYINIDLAKHLYGIIK